MKMTVQEQKIHRLVEELQREKRAHQETHDNTFLKGLDKLKHIYSFPAASSWNPPNPASNNWNRSIYMELQEVKKPQEALIAQLADKNKEIEYLMEQHRAKLAAKDSEIQNLKEMIQGGDEMNEKAVVADGQSE
ncbi:hypothetical protein CRE_01294 [Caenorhabditis remanei]|uniref:Uncharacterized protein n=1 Tax=Caenorhabditis remanei TaxID=31234 RepID=E3N9T2_CAERE|nr:hypothetical protein CRE_01294 [Caenorhabditis remanei]